jgi:hypothetical protein
MKYLFKLVIFYNLNNPKLVIDDVYRVFDKILMKLILRNVFRK